MALRNIIAPIGLTVEASNASAVDPRFATAGEIAFTRDQARRSAKLDVFMAARPDLSAYRGVTASDIGAPQYGPSFARTGLRGLDGNIPGDLAIKLGQISSAVGAASIDAWKAVANNDTWLNSAWRQKIGSDTSFAAAKTLAAAQSTLAATVDAKVRRVLASDDLTAAQQFVLEAKTGRWADISVLNEALDLISAAGGARIIGGGIVKDAGDALVGSGKGWLTILKYLPYIAGGAVLLWGTLFVLRVSKRANPGTAGLSRPRRRNRRSR